nr:hypothetical protein HUO10_006305 [Paraburkholderia busanensis]
MRRATISALYLLMGLFASWQLALLASRIAQQWSWPIVSTRWHSCWDIEHCVVPWSGDVMIALYLTGPALVWTIAGSSLASRITVSRMLVSAALLAVGTALFYFAFHALVWP